MNFSNYADALAKSFLFYEAQRSGQLPVNNRVSWRRNSALGDAVARYDANNNGLLEANETLSRDLSGGYYDAGDRMKYAFPLASAMTMLAWGVTQYQTAYSQSGQLGSALASIKWGADWLLKSHETTGTGTNLQTLRLWGQVGRTDVDHNTWSDDQNIAMPRPAYFVDSSKPGSDLAGEVAAAFAAASIAFRSTNPTYANLLLDHAKAVFKFAYQYPGLYSDSITDSLYGSNNFNDELAWGAVWLHKAIQATNGNVNEPLSWANNQTYLQIARSKNIGLGDWTQTWGNKEYGTAILIAQQDPNYNRTDIESWLNYWTVPGPNSIPYTSGGLAFLNQWGSLRYAANTAFLAAVYSDTIQDYNGRYSNFVKGQIDYILGNNPRGSSYMVGFGSTYSKNPHHAHAHLNGRPDYNGNNGWDLFNANTPSHNLLSGALVGGPGSINDFDYQDTIQDYIRNEVSLDYNAGLTGALAYLYSLGSSNLPAITLAVSPASVLENGTTNLVYTFTRTGSTISPLTVNLALSGTATNGIDYISIPTTATFVANSATAVVTLTPIDDLVVESNETAILSLLSGSGYTLGSATSATVTIADNDWNGTANNDTRRGDAGNNALNGLGGNDSLFGGGGTDSLNGGAGTDNLTGGAGNDVFVFQFGQSILSGIDRIRDLAIGADKIDLLTAAGAALPTPTAFSRAANSAAAALNTVVNNVFTDANGAIAGNQALAINSAALVVATAAGISGTYLVVNDGMAGYQATMDLVVNLTGLSGSLPALGAITPSPWFV